MVFLGKKDVFVQVLDKNTEYSEESRHLLHILCFCFSDLFQRLETPFLPMELGTFWKYGIALVGDTKIII